MISELGINGRREIKFELYTIRLLEFIQLNNPLVSVVTTVVSVIV